MITEILNGYANYFVNNNAVESIAKERAEICAKCPYAKRGLHTALMPDMQISEIKGLYCDVCKCPLSAKVRSKNTKCPKAKW